MIYPDKENIFEIVKGKDDDEEWFWNAIAEQGVVPVDEEDKENQVPSDIFQIIYRFETIAKEYLDAKKRDACEAIKKHLSRYGAGEKQRRYSFRSEKIAEICEKAGNYLKLNYNYSGERIAETSKYRAFQKSWLINVPRLLPEDNVVLEILPYLLTCYTINVSKNKIDPFDAPEERFRSGWKDIFQEFIADKDELEAHRYHDQGNRSKSIRSLSHQFILPHKTRFCALFYDEDSLLYEISEEANEVERHMRASEILKKSADHWEFYRRFAAFCWACSALTEVNLTLSMALFASIWNFCNGCSEFGNCEKSPGLCIYYTDGMTGEKEVYQYSQAEVEEDSARELVINLMGRQASSGDETMSIHEIAFYVNLSTMENKLRWVTDDNIDNILW